MVIRQTIPNDKRRKRVKELLDAGKKLSEVVTELRYAPMTIAFDLLAVMYPDQFDDEEAKYAYYIVRTRVPEEKDFPA